MGYQCTAYAKNKMIGLTHWYLKTIFGCNGGNALLYVMCIIKAQNLPFFLDVNSITGDVTIIEANTSHQTNSNWVIMIYMYIFIYVYIYRYICIHIELKDECSKFPLSVDLFLPFINCIAFWMFRYLASGIHLEIWEWRRNLFNNMNKKV